jgi:hypothetical protein
MPRLVFRALPANRAALHAAGDSLRKRATRYASLTPNVSLRNQLDLDSVGLLNFVIARRVWAAQGA